MSFDMENAKFIIKGFMPGNVRDAMTDMMKEIERLRATNAHQTTRIMRLKLERDSLLAVVWQIARSKAEEMAAKFEKENEP